MKSKPIRCIWKSNGCLELIVGLKNKRGYGSVKREGRQIGTHRWIFFINNSYIPEVVMHKCDNPKCINPLHLEAGNNKKNAEDMVKKNRQCYGEKNKGGNKLNEIQVKQIKSLIPTMSLQKIANQFNVSKKMILLIKQGKRWKYVKDI